MDWEGNIIDVKPGLLGQAPETRFSIVADFERLFNFEGNEQQDFDYITDAAALRGDSRVTSAHVSLEAFLSNEGLDIREEARASEVAENSRPDGGSAAVRRNRLGRVDGWECISLEDKDLRDPKNWRHEMKDFEMKPVTLDVDVPMRLGDVISNDIEVYEKTTTDTNSRPNRPCPVSNSGRKEIGERIQYPSMQYSDSRIIVLHLSSPWSEHL